jgi:hypothetical protein
VDRDDLEIAAVDMVSILFSHELWDEANKVIALALPFLSEYSKNQLNEQLLVPLAHGCGG